MIRSNLMHNPIRNEWLSTRTEEAIDPDLPIVDSHHHLYDRPGVRYLLGDMLSDIRCGHNIRASIYVQARSMLRAAGPESQRHIGETEFANGVAAMCASGKYGDVRLCAGIVGFADLRLGDELEPILNAHIVAAGGAANKLGRFRGIRHIAAWDKDKKLVNPVYEASEDMLASKEFRAGFALLEPLGLSFDAWLYFHQIPRLVDLARAYPATQIVLNHCGGVLGVGSYAELPSEVFRQWKANMRILSSCPNVMVKLGGLGMRLSGLGFENRVRAPSSIDLADNWRPWFDCCFEYFGSKRCMVESNFPVDKGSYSYGIGWNAMKRIFSTISIDERADVFWRTASTFYQLEIEDLL